LLPTDKAEKENEINSAPAPTPETAQRPILAPIQPEAQNDNMDISDDAETHQEESEK